jgi:hypothetical protein
MRFLTLLIFVLALLAWSQTTYAAGLLITDAKIAAGSLTVHGRSPLANQTVELDGKSSVQSDATRNFTFGVPYVPADCVVQITAGASSKKAAIANCAVGQPRGANVTGQITIPTGYVANGRCRQVDTSIGGSKAGQAVVFSSQGALQDGVILYGSRVSSDGHVTLNVCNFSATTQAAITELPVHVITYP